MSKATAKKELSLLLQEFGKLYESGGLKDASEATARTWVERFLAVFGWNPSDPGEVRQEYRIRGRAARRLRAEGTSHRKPDYCLISNGQRLLYIDVKRMSADLQEDSSIAYQVRCYGWSENFKVSYAFDFEELAIFDCRIPPSDQDDADVARILYLRYSDFLSRFDALWDFFAKEALDSGSLFRLLPEDAKPKGSRTLDQDFEEKLGVWRKELAKSILRYGKERNVETISAAAQRILDRIVFLRICEEFGIEELGTLLEMGTHEDGFWPLFLEEHDKRYSRIYDGILFPASAEDDPTGVDEKLRSWWLKGRIFRDIVLSLYYPKPYRFDVLPIELLGGVYERYLGKRLRIIGNDVQDEYKPEYQRSKGAVYTPPWVVRRIVEKTLAPLIENKSPDDILQMRFLDPACGSAGFLLGVHDYLETRLLRWFVDHPKDHRKHDFIFESSDGPALRSQITKRLINECLYGVDIDAEAVEVARMSLALRYLERTAAQDGEPHDLLKGIGLNIRHGNSLVSPDIQGLGLNGDIVTDTLPFDWSNRTTGFGDILARGGFDAVVGNPPYIEVKRYKEWMPAQYRYLKESGAFETTVQGKTDVAMPFMERGLKLLAPGGRLGFIIQNRFFRTDYGAVVRAWLRREKAVADVEDFRDLQIFSGRTTYTAILILQKNSPSIRYRTYDSIGNAQIGKPCEDTTIDWADVNSDVWAFDQPDLMGVHRQLERKHGTIALRKELQISVGLQTLYGKYYQLDPINVGPRVVTGRNGDGEEVTLERNALRPLCRNRGFYPFRQNNADAWVIFPYDIAEGQAHEIEWTKFKERFPKTADYLEERKKKIKNGVDIESSPNRWHLYRYPKNLASQAMPKVLFPMTVEDISASVDYKGDIYQDNVNINSISLVDASGAQLQAIAAVVNSTLFNALGRLKAGLNDAGWRKFNRQYAELVPFPSSILHDESFIKDLAAFSDKITVLQGKALTATSEGAKAGYRATLESLWAQLDRLVEDIYGLTKTQKKVIAKYPRWVNRFDLLFRQAEVPEDSE